MTEIEKYIARARMWVLLHRIGDTTHDCLYLASMN